ncbi:hypothetical protein [Minwuia sp.]|uniref:hypothetical protein n=1 Tax=Minwuia sp. TaxID=2493630 RepID=UPI003A95C026
MSSKYIPKVRVPVMLAFADGTALDGNVYILATERVLDMLNQHEHFFPLELSDGDIHLISKREVLWVKPHDNGG